MAQLNSSTSPPIRTRISYRLHRPRPRTLRLWTLQPQSVWDCLCQQGELSVDLTQIKTDIDRPPFVWAYDYMREQMAHRLSGYQGYYPWWAWCQPKPDL